MSDGSAQVGEKAASAVGIELPERADGTTTDVMLWTTRIAWGTGDHDPPQRRTSMTLDLTTLSTTFRARPVDGDVNLAGGRTYGWRDHRAGGAAFNTLISPHHQTLGGSAEPGR